MAGLNAGTSIVRWIDGHSFFGRPRYDRRQLNCQQAEKLTDYATRLTSCRFKAANSCATPDIGITWTGDSCVCSTLWAYATKFSQCWADTPYSACYGANNNAIYSSWSTVHCTTTKPGPSSSALRSVPVLVSSSIAPVTIAPPSQPSASPKEESKPAPVPSPAPSTQRQDPKPSDPPRATDIPSRSTPDPKPSVNANPPPTAAPGPSSEAQKSKTEKTNAAPPTSVPEPSFVTISVAARTTIDSSSGATVSTTPTHVPIPKWSGTGALLEGYCATPAYTMIDGPTAYWAPVVGCIQDKPDCCPYDIPPSTIAVDAAAAETGAVSGGGGIAGAAQTSRGFPSALSPAQATLSKCPDDYHSIGDGCCPSNYYPWSTIFGGQTPCYSTLRAAMTPPPVYAVMASDPSTPTSAIVNVVYAVQYPLKYEPPKSGLSSGAKIGIGAGAGVAAIVFGVLIFLLAWKHKQHKRDKKALEEMSGIGSTRQSVAASSAFGGVKDWRKTVSSEVSSGLETVQEPTLPRVGEPPQTYPANWRPGQQHAVAHAVPHPGYYTTSPMPDGFSEVGSENGYSNGNRSELHSGDYGMPRQELQGGYGEWQHEGVAQQVRYYEAPAGRMTPMPPSPAPGAFYRA